jgi:hypothetical protein
MRTRRRRRHRERRYYKRQAAREVFAVVEEVRWSGRGREIRYRAADGTWAWIHGNENLGALIKLKGAAPRQYGKRKRPW